VQLYASGKGVLDFGPGRFVTRFEMGTTWNDDVQELPVSVRYFRQGQSRLNKGAG